MGSSSLSKNKLSSIRSFRKHLQHHHRHRHHPQQQQELCNNEMMSCGRQVVRLRLVRMKVRRLQRIVPGGQDLEPDSLFLQTAKYILHLRLQANILQALSNICAARFKVFDGWLKHCSCGRVYQ